MTLDLTIRILLIVITILYGAIILYAIHRTKDWED